MERGVRTLLRHRKTILYERNATLYSYLYFDCVNSRNIGKLYETMNVHMVSIGLAHLNNCVQAQSHSIFDKPRRALQDNDFYGLGLKNVCPPPSCGFFEAWIIPPKMRGLQERTSIISELFISTTDAP